MHVLRVLFFVADNLTADVRLKPLLDPLSASGRVRYACVNRNMKISGQVSDKYDVLITHRNLSRRQTKWLRQRDLPFVYDIDDLLLVDPRMIGEERLGSRRAAQQASIQWCLQRAVRVTSPSRRLFAELDRMLNGGLEHTARFLPNPGQDEIPPGKEGACSWLIWTSSAQPMVAPDLEEACLGIADAARAEGLGVLLVGQFSERLQKLLNPSRMIGWLEPEAYLELVRREALVAVAPLSECLASAQQRFADCKSDIKIAQYASSRVAGAYSRAPPFVESDLPRRIVSENSREAWRDAVIELAQRSPQAGNDLGEHPAVLARRPSVVAEKLYLILCEAAERAEPFRIWAIPTPDVGRRIEARIRSLTSRLKPTRSA